MPFNPGVPNPHTSAGNDSLGTAEYDDMAMLTPEEMKDFAIQHIIQIQGTLKVTQHQNEEILREHNTLKALLDQFQADSQRQLDSLRHNNQALREDLQILQGYEMPDAIRDLTKQARDQRKFLAQVNRASSEHCTLLQERVTELETANENAATEKAELLDLVHELKGRVKRVEDSRHDTGLWDHIGQLELDLKQV
jgi:chromosome segregation ATPase